MRKQHPLLSTTLLVLRLALGALFIFAAYQKLGPDVIPDTSPAAIEALKTGGTIGAYVTPAQDFANAIHAFDIIPDHLIPIMTYAIPWTEAICGVLLIIGFRTRAAAFVLTGAIGAFIYSIVHVVQMHGGEPVECGCFGKFNFPCDPEITDGVCQIARNSVLGVVSLVILFLGPGAVSIDRVISRSKRRPRPVKKAPLGKALEDV